MILLKELVLLKFLLVVFFLFGMRLFINLFGKYFSGKSFNLNATRQIASTNSKKFISMCLADSNSLTCVIIEILNNEPISPEPIDLLSSIPELAIIAVNSSMLIKFALPGLQYFPEFNLKRIFNSSKCSWKASSTSWHHQCSTLHLWQLKFLNSGRSFSLNSFSIASLSVILFSCSSFFWRFEIFLQCYSNKDFHKLIADEPPFIWIEFIFLIPSLCGSKF